MTKRWVLVFICLLLSCVGTSLARSTTSSGEPRHWEEVCAAACKDPITVEIVEKDTGRHYFLDVAIIDVMKKHGCECGPKRYK